MSELTAEDLESMDNADVDWVETVRALQAENKRLTAERDAAAQEAATLRVELDHLADACEVGKTMAAVVQAQEVLATPSTAHAKLAAARAEYIAADMALQAAQSRTESIAVLNALDARKKRADYTLAVAEEEAGVDGDA